MVTDEQLKRLKDYAYKVINEDERHGVTVTLAMDPVMVYLMAGELLRRREKDPWQLETPTTIGMEILRQRNHGQ